MPEYYLVEKCRTRNIYFTFLLCLPSSLQLKICSAMTFDKDVAAPLQKTHSLPNKLSAMIQGVRMMPASDILGGGCLLLRGLPGASPEDSRSIPNEGLKKFRDFDRSLNHRDKSFSMPCVVFVWITAAVVFLSSWFSIIYAVKKLIHRTRMC